MAYSFKINDVESSESEVLAKYEEVSASGGTSTYGSVTALENAAMTNKTATDDASYQKTMPDSGYYNGTATYNATWKAKSVGYNGNALWNYNAETKTQNWKADYDELYLTWLADDGQAHASSPSTDPTSIGQTTTTKSDTESGTVPYYVKLNGDYYWALSYNDGSSETTLYLNINSEIGEWYPCDANFNEITLQDPLSSLDTYLTSFGIKDLYGHCGCTLSELGITDLYDDGTKYTKAWLDVSNLRCELTSGTGGDVAKIKFSGTITYRKNTDEDSNSWTGSANIDKSFEVIGTLDAKDQARVQVLIDKIGSMETYYQPYGSGYLITISFDINNTQGLWTNQYTLYAITQSLYLYAQLSTDTTYRWTTDATDTHGTTTSDATEQFGEANAEKSALYTSLSPAYVKYYDTISWTAVIDTYRTSYKWVLEKPVYADAENPVSNPTSANDTTTTLTTNNYITSVSAGSFIKYDNTDPVMQYNYDWSDTATAETYIGKKETDTPSVEWGGDTQYMALPIAYTETEYNLEPDVVVYNGTFVYDTNDTVKTYIYSQNDSDVQIIKTNATSEYIDYANLDEKYTKSENLYTTSVDYNELQVNSVTFYCAYSGEGDPGVLYSLRSNINLEKWDDFVAAVHNKFTSSDVMIEVGRFIELPDGKIYVALKNTGATGSVTINY